ncbi:MAG: protease complex subunit PrcB family protein [Chloroflexota bacterium]
MRSASATGAPSDGGVSTVDFGRLTDAIPVARNDAAIEMAFDAGQAQGMVVEAPPIDFATQALLCLSLGERPTGGWSVTVQSMRIVAGELQILAREARPRVGEGTTQAFTYPADCVVLDRTQLPTGALAVRADDTISDEFIVDAVIEVPPR